jgi:hypothetical protein
MVVSEDEDTGFDVVRWLKLCVATQMKSGRKRPKAEVAHLSFETSRREQESIFDNQHHLGHNLAHDNGR